MDDASVGGVRVMNQTFAYRGLSSAEARERLRIAGLNQIARESLLKRLEEVASVFADPMALMLGAGSVVYFLLGRKTEAIVLFAAIFPVLAIDVILEARSRGAVKKLAEAVSPRATVIRDGAEVEIDSALIVPGDLMLVSEGGVAHADGLVRIGANLTVDESQLTGEAEPQVKKAVEPGEKGEREDPDSQVYAGSPVLTGHGWTQVTATGAHTRYGVLAQLVAEASDRLTPLQQKTGRFVKWIVAIAVSLSAGLFLFGIARGEKVGEAFLSAISLAMSSVGEEFLIVLTTFLSLGAWRLRRYGVLVKWLASVETLGATTTICVDKTGTLTVGDFRVIAVVNFGQISEQRLLENAVLACEAAPADAIERAIFAHCASSHIDPDAVHLQWQLIRDHPFDLVGKHMSHVWRSKQYKDGSQIRIVAKGSVEGVLEHADISYDERVRVQAENEELASKGIRVLAIAGRDGLGEDNTREEDERGLRIYGLIGFSDPIRPEVPAAISECQRAGVRVKLITGDHAITAHAIADAAGIAHEGAGIITGAELDRLSQKQFDEAVERCSIFARVRPEQKYAIVDLLERAGEIVAMTGDGINDTPAMRRADIAISMGRRATEVARSVADLVLLEDDFTSIVSTIREGRHIYRNIQRAFLYLIGFKFMLVLTALVVPLAGLPILLLPVDLVWLELIVHPVSALALEGGKPTTELMRVGPRNPKEPLIKFRPALLSALCGCMLSMGAVLCYWGRLPSGESYARGVAMTIVIIGSLMMVLADYLRPRMKEKVKIPREMRFWLILACVALSLPLFMSVGFISSVLMIRPIAAADWALALCVCLLAVGWRAVTPW
jgi:Ca2+-transporting ATPase